MNRKIQRVMFLIILSLLFFSTDLSSSFDSVIEDYGKKKESVREPSNSLIWTSSELISNNSDVNSYRPTIATDMYGDLHIVWEERISANNTILYRKKDSDSGQWMSTVVISDNSQFHSNSPVIKTDDMGNVHIVWFDFIDVSGNDKDIIYKFWNSTTDMWGNYEIISTESSASSIWPDLAIDGSGNLHVTWMDNWIYNGSDNIDYDIFYKTKNKTTGLWSSLEIISAESSVDSWWPTITVDESKVSIVWEDLIAYRSDHDLLFKYKNLTSNLWSTLDIILSGDPFKYLRPKVIADDLGDLHLVLNTNSYSDIFYSKWNSTTQNWDSLYLVSTLSSIDAFVPSIAIDHNDNIHIFWFDNTNALGSGTDADIFSRMWNATSGIWGNIELVTSDSTYYSWRPTVALDPNNNIHVVWHEGTGTGSDSEIFYLLGFDPSSIPDIALISRPADAIIEFHTLNNRLTWLISAKNISNPTYAIYRDSNFLVNQTWVSNTPITTNIDGLELGDYNYRIIATDGNGNNIADQVIVSVQNFAPVIQGTGNIYYKAKSFGHQITWNIVDSSYLNPTYAVLRNGSELLNQSLNFGEPINVNIDGLDEGEYLYKLIVDDGLGKITEDEVLVVVLLSENDIITVMISVSSGLGIALIVVGISLYLTRRK